MSIERNELVELMEKRGYTVYASSAVGSSIQFISAHMYKYHRNPLDGPVVNVMVTLSNENFRFIYNIPKSINQLISPDCSPVSSDKQFERIESKLLRHARRLESFEEE